MQKTFIFGHKKPDTDSVVSAIALSYLKNKLGEVCEPRVLSSINKEAAFALDYFNQKVPRYLNDVKLQIRDIDYHKGFYIKETDSIYLGYQKMLEENVTGVPVVREDHTFYGLLTIKDLSRVMIGDDMEHIHTSYDNLLHVLKAEEVFRFTDEIEGNLLIASFKNTTFMSNINLKEDDIVILGDRNSLVEYAVNSKVKLLILSGDSEVNEEYLELARINNVSIIKTKYDTYNISRLIVLSNYIKTLINLYNPTSFFDTDFVSDVEDINNKLKHTNYPVVNKDNKCLGLLRITDLSEKHPKKVILVDHNEKIQSVDGLDEAEIVEIIDHHNLGNITTNNPVNFRNMSVGSTSTIIYTLFREKEIEIPKDIAGLLLSGVLSDTLILKSPTTTTKDREAVEELSFLAEVDYEEYGMKLLKSGTSLEGMSKEDVLYNDYKTYTVGDKKFAIGQFFTMNFEEIEKEITEYVDVLNKVNDFNNYSLVALYVTDIVKNGSYVIFNEKGSNIMSLAYQQDIEEGHFIEGCVSRKKHIVPVIMDILDS